MTGCPNPSPRSQKQFAWFTEVAELSQDVAAEQPLVGRAGSELASWSSPLGPCAINMLSG